MSTPEERRRYALLQAAATLQPHFAKFGIGIDDCVEVAEQILAKIEQREMDNKK